MTSETKETAKQLVDSMRKAVNVVGVSLKKVYNKNFIGNITLAIDFLSQKK